MLVLLTLLLGGAVALSLRWRIEHDAPLMLYFAWLTGSQGLVLYRDVFEHQPLGAHLLYRLVSIAGPSDLGYRLFDLGWLAAILAVDVALLAPFGRRVAWAGAVLFGLAYLGHGPIDSLQRDFLMILPVAAAALLEARRLPARRGARAALVGLLLGLAFTVKPQTGLLLLAFVLLSLRRAGEAPGSRWAALAALAAGFALPSLAVVAELWRSDTLGAFADVVRHYWPLFARLDIQHRTLDDAERLPYLLAHLRQLGGQGGFAAAGVLGLYVAGFASPLGERERRTAGLLGMLALLSLGTTAAAGRFWAYHWFLFLHFAVLCAALCLVEPRPALGRGAAVFAALVLLAAACLALQPAPALRAQLAGAGPPAPEGGRADEIAAFLRDHLRPGDTVQSLDWTGGGAVHAMLLARAPTATPFVTDFSFYHHVSDPWIQQLRRRFVRALTAARPRFVVDVFGPAKPWPRGRDTSRRFPELENLLANDYRVVARGRDYRIHERRDAPPHTGFGERNAAPPAAGATGPARPGASR